MAAAAALPPRGPRGTAARRAAWFWCLVSSALPRTPEAIVKRINEPVRDALWTFLKYDMGLDPGSHVEMDLYNDLPANNTYVVVLTHDQWMSWRRVEPTALPSSSGDEGASCLNSYLVSYWRGGLNDRLQVSFKIEAPAKDRYHVGVLNAQQQVMKLRGTLSMVNPGGRQLPLQEELVPSILLWTAALFFLSTLAYAAFMAAALARPGRTVMHFLLGSTLLLKGCVLILWWLDCWKVARDGSSDGLSQVDWQLLEKVQTIVELMMFLFVALGWKFLRPTLNVAELRFAIGMSVMSFYLGVFEVTSPTQSAYSGYQLSRYILHSLCYLVVIVAMNFNLQMVHAQLAEAPASLESGVLYKKYRAYKVFRWIFLAFVIAPTVELFLKVAVIPWDALWLFVLLQQLRTWAVSVAVIVAFARLPDPPPLRVVDLARDHEGAEAEADEEAAGSETGGAAGGLAGGFLLPGVLAGPLAADDESE